MKTLAIIFAVLFFQLLVVLLASLRFNGGVALVRDQHFGWDLSDFVAAARDWSQDINPYLRHRFVTPPPSLVVGLAFQHLGPEAASCLFLGVNLAAMAGSIWMISRCFGLSLTARWLMIGIASVYYPVLFLFERGNLDGLMLLFLCWAVTVRNTGAKTLLLSASIALKVYSVALLPATLLRKQYRLFAAIVAVVALVALPFHGIVPDYLGALKGRAWRFSSMENLSPSVLLGPLCYYPATRVFFFATWAATLWLAAWRHRELPMQEHCVLLFPWMMAFPLQVYPYTGVLLLPVLALRTGKTFSRAAGWSQGCFLAGFLLTGTQQDAMQMYFRWPAALHSIFPFLGGTGTLLGLISCSFGLTGGKGVSSSATPVV